MKKLLLVLMVVAMASFLFVGCLPGVVVDDGDDDGTVVPVTMTIEDEYKSTAGVTYVGCAKDVTVTFPTPVAIDYVVYIARKLVEGDGTVTYKLMPEPEPVAATPNADRTIWTVEDYEFLYGYPCEERDGFKAPQANGFLCECEPICLVALVKHPCCPGEEVALRVVTIDCVAPYADLAVTFKDCFDPCADTDECNPFVGGAYFEFSSREVGACATTDCCGDDCSGFASWTLVVDPDPCAPACDTVTGSACPVEGIVDCGCLLYAAGGDEPNLTYDVTYTLLDNVGNKFEDTWTITVDTDSVTNISVPLGTGGAVTIGTPLYIYEDNCVVLPS